MARNYFLKNLPPRQALERLVPRFPDLDVSALQTYRTLLRVASDIIAETDSQMAALKTSQGRLRLLMELSNDPKSPLGPSELAERIGVTRATVTGLLDGLEGSGLLKRERPEGDDRRCVKVRLTPAGNRFLDRAIPERLRRIAGLMDKVTEAERGTLSRLLEKVSEGLPAYRGK